MPEETLIDNVAADNDVVMWEMAKMIIRKQMTAISEASRNMLQITGQIATGVQSGEGSSIPFITMFCII